MNTMHGLLKRIVSLFLVLILLSDSALGLAENFRRDPRSPLFLSQALQAKLINWPDHEPGQHHVVHAVSGELANFERWNQSVSEVVSLIEHRQGMFDQL